MRKRCLYSRRITDPLSLQSTSLSAVKRPSPLAASLTADSGVLLLASAAKRDRMRSTIAWPVVLFLTSSACAMTSHMRTARR